MEVTRRGIKEEMLKIAELTKRTVVDGEQPENVKKDVVKLRAEFQKVKHCFENKVAFIKPSSFSFLKSYAQRIWKVNIP